MSNFGECLIVCVLNFFQTYFFIFLFFYLSIKVVGRMKIYSHTLIQIINFSSMETHFMLNIIQQEHCLTKLKYGIIMTCIGQTRSFTKKHSELKVSCWRIKSGWISSIFTHLVYVEGDRLNGPCGTWKVSFPNSLC